MPQFFFNHSSKGQDLRCSVLEPRYDWRATLPWVTTDMPIAEDSAWIPTETHWT